MSNPSALSHNPDPTHNPPPQPPAASTGLISRQPQSGGAADPRIPILLNLSTIQSKMESLKRFLSNSINNNTLLTKHQSEMVSDEISSAVDQVIINGAALLATQPEEIASDLNFLENHTMNINGGYKTREAIESDDRWEIIEFSSAQLLGARKHCCDLCGKEFKWYANLRIHIRTHENQSKSSELWKKRARFSCPFIGCERNKLNEKFRPLKSVVCAKNHYRRSHCPKMYSCTRCNRKSFSVLADLKSHLKHCGESRFRCSCGTSFLRRDKLVGHMTLFEGHLPAAMEEDGKAKGEVVMVRDEEDEDQMGSCSENRFLEGVFEEFDSIEKYCLQGALGDSSNL
ncbi:hypothetical protein LOK49_LG01G02792 [Camellia lanceoleosa]|uniref:Uncharacterized protein n=1 Tax=Camellia lanceoleosa TaxID=1840588 RepID=A0ACC0J1L1_9ERIC|nr:hypothetical protein LOK49_LG01G02792 [Camellia lanceoleosa]